MSEVKPVHRYKAQTLFSFGGAKIEYFPHGPEVVLATELDAQRLRADTAEAELKKAKEWASQYAELESVFHSERDIWNRESSANAISHGETQKKLAAAEQRIADLKCLLLEVANSAPTGFASLDNEMAHRVNAALNPNPEAESHE